MKNISGSMFGFVSRRRLIPLATILLLAAATLSGQEISGNLCRDFEKSLVKELNPMSVDRRDINSRDCQFEFTLTGDIDLSVGIEKHVTEAEGKLSLDRFLTLIATGDGLQEVNELPFSQLESHGKWDESYYLKGELNGTGIIAVRKGKYAVKVLSQNDEALHSVERLLRQKGLGLCQ